jgi:tetratricopeptide (TPR) repeat protein
MKFRRLLLCALCTAGVAAAVPTLAAETVVGQGLAQSCYQSAEFGGDPETGIPDCTGALNNEVLSPRDRAATFINRGILRARNKNTDGAFADYNIAIGMMPNVGEAYVDRGAAYIAIRRYKEALADLNKGIALGSTSLHLAYYDRAIADEALGDIKGAYEDYKQALVLMPNFAPALEQLKRFKVISKPDGTTDASGT